MLDERLSVAPMMEWTDRHYRYFIRGLSKKTVLYTEMVVDDAINHSPNFDILVGTDIEEQPSVIQLGGHNPETLAAAAEVCSIYGRSYDEINLNCGCPSQRVSKRCFGAKLMEEPELVREIVSQMQRRTFQHVTVKCRLGVDKKDSYKELCDFLMACHQGKVKMNTILSADSCLYYNYYFFITIANDRRR
jgi:tRNA-dihydrouridine synthase A